MKRAYRITYTTDDGSHSMNVHTKCINIDEALAWACKEMPWEEAFNLSTVSMGPQRWVLNDKRYDGILTIAEE